MKAYTYTLWNQTVQLEIPKGVFPTEEVMEKQDEPFTSNVNHEHGWMKSNSSGHFLHYRKISPSYGDDDEEKEGQTRKESTAIPTAVVVFMHGIHEHSGQGWILSDDDGRKVNLALMKSVFVEEKRCVIYALDMQGHGFSEGCRMYVPSYETNVDDLDQLCRLASSEYPADVPFFLMGNSYGGTLALHVASKWETQRERQQKEHEGALPPPSTFETRGGLILIAPAIVGDLPPQPILFILRRIIAKCLPRWTPFFMPNPISPERIWRDRKVMMLHMDDHEPYRRAGLIAVGLPFRLGTASQLIQALEDVRNLVLPSFTSSFCVLHGTDDAGVPIEGTDLLEQTVQTPSENFRIHRMEGLYHDLLGDPEANRVMEHISDYIDGRLK